MMDKGKLVVAILITVAVVYFGGHMVLALMGG